MEEKKVQGKIGEKAEVKPEEKKIKEKPIRRTIKLIFRTS